MFEDPSHYIQLFAAIALAGIFFVWASVVSDKWVIGLLILLIPFQIISSRYGSLNVVLTYAVGVVFLLGRRLSYFPLITAVAFIVFAYLLSFSQARTGASKDHAIYLFSIGANFILFYIVYNSIYKMKEEGLQFFWKILMAVNVLVLGYCMLQLIGGLTGTISFGLDELTLNQVRPEHQRLTGPFHETALTAEYLDIQLLIIFYTIMHEKIQKRKNILWLLFALNSAFLITTGNRGGIVTLVFGLMLFMYMFRKELGKLAIIRYVSGGILLFSLMGVVIIKYTDFNVLFERLKNTEMDGVVPDSRAGWKYVLPKVLEKPVLGHGPRLMLHPDTYANNRNIFAMPQPHSAYLYLMYTIGSVGLIAYIIFFISVWKRFSRASKIDTENKFLDGIPTLGMIIILMIAASQIRMEMFRFITSDYQQFVFMLLAAFMALTQIKRSAVVLPDNFDKATLPGEINALNKRSILRRKHGELKK